MAQMPGAAGRDQSVAAVADGTPGVNLLLHLSAQLAVLCPVGSVVFGVLGGGPPSPGWLSSPRWCGHDPSPLTLGGSRQIPATTPRGARRDPRTSRYHSRQGERAGHSRQSAIACRVRGPPRPSPSNRSGRSRHSAPSSCGCRYRMRAVSSSQPGRRAWTAARPCGVTGGHRRVAPCARRGRHGRGGRRVPTAGWCTGRRGARYRLGRRRRGRRR